MKHRHINIPIFIPHLGCPNNCVFCNQRKISGHGYFDRDTVKNEIDAALSTINANAEEVELAYFGGSFTGIDRELMLYLLKLAHGYIESGDISSVRVSTRPDYIDEEILGILGEYSVKTVELGIQSISERVLSASRRGHSFEDTKRSCRMITERGFSLVGQMMIGLPESTPEDEVATAEFISHSGAFASRVYPTVVFYDTELCEMAKLGKYSPLTTEQAVERTKNVLAVFDENKIDCIRVGLHSSEKLASDKEVYGGASHAAIGELSMSALYFDKICAEIEAKKLAPAGKTLKIEAAVGSTSKVVGQKRENIRKLIEKYKIINAKVIENPDYIRYNIKIGIL